MRPEDVHKWLHRQPFQAFRVVLSNGTTYEIRHPELVMVGRSELSIGTPAPGFDYPTYDKFISVALLHINNIEPLSPARRR